MSCPRSRCLRSTLLAAALALAVAAPARAVTMTLTAATPADAIAYRLYSTLGKTQAWEFNALLAGVQGISYSVEIPPIQGQGTSSLFSLEDLSVLPGAYAAAWLLLHHAPERDTANGMLALQLAIWETVYDTSWDLASGNFQVIGGNAGALGLASSWLAQIPAGVGPADTFDVVITEHPAVRDMLFVSLETLAVIPEPAPALLLALGLFGLAARRRD
jgi:hypothetical protein